jgi:transposase
MAAVMIGVDPHKGSHTAVVIDQAEMALGEVRVRASASQVQQLLEWAAAWAERTWAVEGTGGLGHLLARQLVRAGAAAGRRQCEQGRPGRCPVGGHRGAAVGGLPAGAGR